jgi:hypothetical protein
MAEIAKENNIKYNNILTLNTDKKQSILTKLIAFVYKFPVFSSICVANFLSIPSSSSIQARTETPHREYLRPPASSKPFKCYLKYLCRILTSSR